MENPQNAGFTLIASSGDDCERPRIKSIAVCLVPTGLSHRKDDLAPFAEFERDLIVCLLNRGVAVNSLIETAEGIVVQYRNGTVVTVHPPPIALSTFAYPAYMLQPQP
jgi:hypothetical protein